MTFRFDHNSDITNTVNIQPLKDMYTSENWNDVQWFVNTYPNTYNILIDLFYNMQSLQKNVLRYYFDETEHENMLEVGEYCTAEQYEELCCVTSKHDKYWLDNIVVCPIINTK